MENKLTAEEKYKSMTQRLRTIYSDQEIADYIKWLFTSDSVNEEFNKPVNKLEQRKFLITAEMRDLEKQVALGEISYGRMIEILCDKADKYALQSKPKQSSLIAHEWIIKHYGNNFTKDYALTNDDVIQFMEEYALQSQPPTVTDEDAANEAKIRYPYQDSFNESRINKLSSKRRRFIEGAKWMRNKLTPNK